jgi:hypothetical protein
MTDEELRAEENRAWDYRVWLAAVLRLRLPGLATAEDVHRAVAEGRLTPGRVPDGECPA